MRSIARRISSAPELGGILQIFQIAVHRQERALQRFGARGR